MSDPVLPPPSDRANPRQMIALFGFGTMLTLFVMTALALSRGQSMRVGVMLIVLGAFFCVGLVSSNRVVQLVAGMVLLAGAGAAISLVRVLNSPLWIVGAVLFLLCAVILFLRPHILRALE